jgi:hypothetical protein
MGINSMFAIYFLWEIIRVNGPDMFVYFGMLLFTIFFISGTVQVVLLVRECLKKNNKKKTTIS